MRCCMVEKLRCCMVEKLRCCMVEKLSGWKTERLAHGWPVRYTVIAVDREGLRLGLFGSKS